MEKAKVTIFNKKFFVLITISFLILLAIYIYLILSSKMLIFVGVMDVIIIIYGYVLSVLYSLDKNEYLKRLKKHRIVLYKKLTRLNKIKPKGDKMIKEIRGKINVIELKIKHFDPSFLISDMV